MNVPTVIVIKPRSGKLLVEKIRNTKIDPYLMISYNFEQEVSKISKMTDKYPFWTDTFEFPFNKQKSKIEIECWNYNQTESDTYLGSGEIMINSDEKLGQLMQWVQLKTKNIEAGEVFFEIELKKSYQVETETTTQVSLKKNPILSKQISMDPDYSYNGLEKENNRRIKKAYSYHTEMKPFQHYYLNKNL